MSVAVANEFVQNAEGPGGNRGQLNWKPNRLSRNRKVGSVTAPILHPSGRNARGVS